MKTWRPVYDRAMCTDYFGNMSQAAGVRRCILADGKARGVEAADVHTGGGLEFTVLPGRGMDIVGCRYQGVPVSYLSKAGITAPSYYDARQNQWLKSFFAGMVTTCGISNAGPACREEHPILGEVLYGLHGDISNTGADQVGIREEWIDGSYQMQVTGRMSEGRLHGEHLSLRRTVSAGLGDKHFKIRDVYQNEGDTREPLMFFYHINIGHPILSKGSRMLSASRQVWAETETAKAGMDRYDVCDGPTPGFLEQQFFHTLYTDENSLTTVALVNEELELGFYLTYSVVQMPYISQWKLTRTGEYVFAFEPGNCHPIGRVKQREKGLLQFLAPMESHTVDMELGILDGADEIEKMRRTIAGYRAGGIEK